MIEVGTDKDYAAHRVSFHLNLTGPSVCVQTSCSTALSCVALACADLHNGSSDRALAGAASILFPQAVRQRPAAAPPCLGGVGQWAFLKTFCPLRSQGSDTTRAGV